MSDYDEALTDLITAIEACRGRVEPAVVDSAQALVDRAGRRDLALALATRTVEAIGFSTADRR